MRPGNAVLHVTAEETIPSSARISAAVIISMTVAVPVTERPRCPPTVDVRLAAVAVVVASRGTPRVLSGVRDGTVVVVAAVGASPGATVLTPGGALVMILVVIVRVDVVVQRRAMRVMGAVVSSTRLLNAKEVWTGRWVNRCTQLDKTRKTRRTKDET